jgi:uncharacterized protein (DUF433 family)
MVAEDNWRNRISVDAQIHHGDPCIRNTRIPVSVIVGSIADGDSVEQIQASWPQLTCEDIRAALHFAAEAVNRFDIAISPAEIKQ